MSLVSGFFCKWQHSISVHAQGVSFPIQVNETADTVKWRFSLKTNFYNTPEV